MKYEEMAAILRRLDESVGDQWGVMSDGPRNHEMVENISRGVSPFLAHYRPWKASGEAAAGLTIGTTANTEPIGRLSGYMMDVRANADFIIHARGDIRLLVAEIVRLNAVLMALGHEAGIEKYDRILNEAGGTGNWLARTRER